MKKPKRLYTFRSRFFLTWGASLVALTIVMAATLFSVGAMLRAYRTAMAEIIRDQASLERVQLAVVRAARIASDYSAYGATQNLDVAVQQVEAALLLARQELNGTPTEAQLLDSAVTEWALFVRFSREVEARPNRSDPNAILVAQRRDGQVDELLRSFGAIHDYLEQEQADEVGAAYAQALRLLVMLALIFVIVYGILLTVGVRFIRSVVRPLNELNAAASRFEAGELGRRVTIQTDDEFGRLGTTFNDMADRLAATVQRLETLSRRDGLTGLYNRREFDERLAAELIRARRYNHPVTLLLFDVDHFKSVNDHYGHQAGDAALKHIAALLRGRLRAADVAFRFGGDEFTILLPETGQYDATALAEGLRTLVASQSLQYQGQALSLSISVGVGSYPECGLIPESLVAVADASLYAAKATRPGV